MITRAYIHITGGSQAGKTTLIETFLQSSDAFTLVARGIRDDSLSRARESAPNAHAELSRYRRAGAIGAALFTFPQTPHAIDEFFGTRLMENYSQAVLIEGDAPAGFGHRVVYVAPPLPEGQSLFVGVTRAAAAEERARARLARRVDDPEEMRRLIGGLLGQDLARIPHLRVRSGPRSSMPKADSRRAGRRTQDAESWAIHPQYRGIEHAHVVVVNVQDEQQETAAARLIDDLKRLRQDDTLFKEILPLRGSRLPITAAAANLTDPRHPGTRKVLARLRRAVRDDSESRA